MRMRWRIVIAVAAIAAVHAAFYAVPRWRATRPAFHGEEYEKVNAMLAEEFGRGAVVKGIVSIPKDELPLPYSGRAMVCRGSGSIMLYIGGPGKASYLFREDWRAGVSVAEIDWQRARSIWALVEYSTRAKAAVRFIEGRRPLMRPMPYGLADTTWPIRRGRRYGLTERFPKEDVWPPTGDDLVTGAVKCRLVDELGSSDLRWVSERGDIKRALAQVIEAVTPARDDLDRHIASALAGGYAKCAGSADSAFLRRLASGRVRMPSWTFALPLVGERLKAWDGYRQHLRGPLVSRGTAWEAETLNDATQAERERILSSIALNTGRAANEPTVERRARQLFASQWPERWKGFLTENYPAQFDWTQCTGIKLGPADKLTQLVAADKRSWCYYDANLTLYKATKDERYLANMEARMLVDVLGNFEYSGVYLPELLSAYRDDRSYVGVPVLVRKLVAGLAGRADAAEVITRELAEAHAEEFDGMLLDIIFEPGKMLNRGLADRDAFNIRRLALENLLAGENPTVESAVIGYIEKEDRPSELGLKLYAATVLANVGHQQSLPALRKALAMSEGAAPSNLIVEAGDRKALPLNLPAAVATLEFRCSPRPMGHYLSLNAEGRRLIGVTALSGCLDEDELKTLLADDRCADARDTVFSAIVDKRIKNVYERNEGWW